jgi:hypothetical protein
VPGLYKVGMRIMSRVGQDPTIGGGRAGSQNYAW